MLLACSVLTGRSLCRDELMAEVGGGMEEDAVSGGDPSIGRRRHGPKSNNTAGLFAHVFYWHNVIVY